MCFLVRITLKVKRKIGQKIPYQIWLHRIYRQKKRKKKKEKLPHETWPFLGNFECMSVAYHHNSMISIWSSCLKIKKTVFDSEILFFLKKERAKLPNASKETGSNFTSILTNITRKRMSMCEECPSSAPKMF